MSGRNLVTVDFFSFPFPGPVTWGRVSSLVCTTWHRNPKMTDFVHSWVVGSGNWALLSPLSIFDHQVIGVASTSFIFRQTQCDLHHVVFSASFHKSIPLRLSEIFWSIVATSKLPSICSFRIAFSFLTMYIYIYK